MNNTTFPRIGRHSVLALGMGLSVSVGWAQSSGNSSSKDQLDRRQDQFEQSVALAKARDYSSAESRLLGDNRSSPNSGAWYLESGQKWALLAAALANRRDYAGARDTATQAIGKLQIAESKLLAEGKFAAASQAQQVIGTIHEHILRDYASAAKAYDKAVGYDSSRDGGKQGAERMKGKEKESGK